MKFLFTADLHLSRYSQDKVEDQTRLPERLSGIKNAIHHMGKYCVENDIDNFVIGGDLLHGKSIIYAIAQAIMLDFFAAYPQLNFYVIDGNHDLSDKGKDAISALKSIDSEPNVTRIHPDGEQIENVLFVPYSYRMVDIIKSSSSDYLVSHFGLNEGLLSSGISIVSDISMRDLAGKYRGVLLGHYHKPQEISSNSEVLEVYYVGSPIQLDWGERHEDKRFLVVDTDNNTIESIPTEGYKKYFEFELTKENREEVLEEARKIQEEGNHVSIKRMEDVDISELSEEFKVIDRVERDITNRGLTSSMTERDKLKRYLEVKEVPEELHDVYLNVALEIIEESQCET